MARAKNVIAPGDARAIEAMELVEQNEKDRQIAAQEAVKFLGFDLKEYDLLLYVKMGKNVFQWHEMTALMGGKILLTIKENEEHGTFGKALEQIGIHPRRAQRYMNLARRFGKYDSVSHLSNSKLDLLEDLTDPELEKLDAGEAVRGLTLDEIDRLPASRVRDRLRVAENDLAKEKEARKKEREAFGKSMLQKDAKINELDMKLDGRDLPTKERIAALALEGLRKKLFEEIQLTRFHFGECLKAIGAAEKIEGATFPMLENWAKEEYEELSGFQPMLEELDEALRYVNPDAGGSEGNAN